MALIVADRVKETTATTGTLDAVLAGAAAGFQAFSGVMSNSDTCQYTITSSNDWEVGEGTYTSGTNSLIRDNVLASSNGGSKISLGGSSTIFLTYPADRSVYRNANNQVVVQDSGLIFNDNSTQTKAGITGSGDTNELMAFDVNGEASGVTGVETNPGGDPGLDIFRESGQATTLVNIYTESTGVLTVIDENGWIGVGTGDPNYHLEVKGTGEFDALTVQGNPVSTGDTTYTAGSGLELSGTQFNAKTATTSASGITTLTNTINGDQDKALTPKAVNDASYLTAESDTLQTVVDRGNVSTTDITVSGLLTAATGVTLEQNTPTTTTDKLYNVGGSLYFNGSAVDTTYTAGSGLQLNGTTFDALTATTSASGITTLTNTIDSTETKALTPKGVNDAGYVVGPALSTDNAIVKYDGTTGKLLQNSSATINDAGTMAISGGIQLGLTNYMGFDSVTITGVTNASPKTISFLGADITGTKYSTYLFMVRLVNITTLETNGASYFFRKSTTQSNSNWESFMWGKKETSAGEGPEVYIDTGEASGGAVQVRLTSANPAGGDTVLAHITAWRIDRGDNELTSFVPEAVFSQYRFASNAPRTYPLDSGTINMYLTSTSTLGVQTTGPATEALDVQNKTYTQSIYNGVPSPTGSPSIELDLDAGNIFNITLDENKTLTIKNNTDNVGQRFIVNLRQASAVTPGSSYTVTWWNNIKWMDDTEPTLSDSGNLIDTFDFHIPSGNKFFGYILGTGVYDG